MMKPINLAAIDIGSNGARLLVKRFDESEPEFDKIRKLMYIRVPLRLGKDVFTLGKISKEREEMMIEMMKGYKHFMKLYNVARYRACATSAMRDAENGKKVIKHIRKATGMELEIIPGQQEAQLLCNNILEQSNSKKGNFAYVDVGGGSTEISLLHDGKLTESCSYNCGTLRMLSGKVGKDTIVRMKRMLSNYAAQHGEVQIIGSGGNINRLFRLSNDKTKGKVFSLEELQRLYLKLKPLSIEERMEQFGLKEDRSDVIIPAAEIFLIVADALNCKSILVPNISLADSIVDGLYSEICEKEGA